MSELYCVNCKAVSPPENLMSHCSAGMKHDWIKSHVPADSQPASDLVEKAKPRIKSPEDFNEVEWSAFRFYNPEPRWRDELEATDFARRAAAFANLHASQQNADLIRERDEAREKVRELEAMLSRTNDIRGFSWHIQRRRENGQIEWFSTSAESGSVFGPFTSALEAFTALEEKEQI